MIFMLEQKNYISLNVYSIIIEYEVLIEYCQIKSRISWVEVTW
jgi:hypothetical protein